MSGKSASAITDYLVSSEAFDTNHCISLLQKSLRKKADEVVGFIQGYQMTETQKKRICMVREHYDFVDALIVHLDEEIDQIVVPYESTITLLCTIPGVSYHSEVSIITEIGTDSKWLCC